LKNLLDFFAVSYPGKRKEASNDKKSRGCGPSLLLSDPNGFTSGEFDQLRRGEAEDCPLVAGGGPDLGVCEQHFIDKRLHGVPQADRRHSPHRKTRLRKDKIERGHFHAFPGRKRQQFGVNPVRPADFHKERFPAIPPAKHERLHNAIQLASQRARRIPGRPRALREMRHEQSAIKTVQRRLHPADGFVDNGIYQRSSFRGRMTV
jgi:hypothetical protein